MDIDFCFLHLEGMLLAVKEELVIELKHKDEYQFNREKAKEMSEKIKNKNTITKFYTQTHVCMI